MFSDAGEHFDYLYVQFYNNFCSPSDRTEFDKSLDKWLYFSNNRQPKGPRILIGLPAHVNASGDPKFFISTANLDIIYTVRVAPCGVKLVLCKYNSRVQFGEVGHLVKGVDRKMERTN